MIIYSIWREFGAPMLRKFIQLVLMYTSLEICKGRNILLFESDPSKLDKVALVAIVATKKI